MQHRLAIAWAAALAACSAPAPPSQQAPRPVTATIPIGAINLMPQVAHWDSSTRQSSRMDRAVALRKTVLERWIVPYGTFFRIPSDSALARYVDWLTPRLPQAERLADQAERELQADARRIAAVFPELAADKHVAIVGPSLGNTNGTVRLVDRKPLLIVGVDVQTILPDSDIYLRATLEHELVHGAHATVNPTVYGMVVAGLQGERVPLYVSLFSEGLATWGSARADNSLQPAHYYMNANLASVPRATCERLAPLLARDLESTDPTRYADWFFLSGKDANIRRRYAYVLGERVVRQMARRYSPAQLLRLDARAILSATRSALADGRAMCG
ncbi:MAG TPA: hypothetical protein VJ867_07925 [Gemmatimonadaceae bacterium]|nr:hypothetical protein [Gemmatimonadaceae bacterium]